MSNEIKRKNLKLYLLSVLLFFTVLESFCSIIYYQINKKGNPSIFASFHMLKIVYKSIIFHSNQNRINAIGIESKGMEPIDLIINLREVGEKSYPNYLFDSQRHIDFSYHHLANVPKSLIVYCKEDYWSIFKTDELGFRNPLGQINEDVDFIFLGDSFVEGACVDDDFTFAGLFRKNNYKVFNLGRGGTGPLSQLATLKEYGNLVKSKNIIWFIFTGNDLQNLREEKGTKLINYIEDINFRQNLYKDRFEVSKRLINFLEKEIKLKIKRDSINLNYSYNHGYGETLDHIEAKEKDVILLEIVAKEILGESFDLASKLKIVILDHPSYDHEIQDITSKGILNFATNENIEILHIKRSFLEKNAINLYSNKGMGVHFSNKGYETIHKIILRELILGEGDFKK